MNLPEYRRAYRMAQERFSAAVSEASEVLGKELAVADERFFEDQEKAVAIDEDYAVMKRRSL